MAKEKNGTQIKEFESVQSALSKSEAFVEKNKTMLLGGLIAVIVVIGAVLFYRNHVLVPNQQAAKEAIFTAEQRFVRDSFRLALEGDLEGMGFLQVIEEYGSTDAGNLAQAYAGVCYKMLGEYETAISYLNKFNASDVSLSPALKGAIGDCYLETGDKEKAISFFQKAVDSNNDMITSTYLYRMGLLYYSMGEFSKAVTAFERIKNEYSFTPLAADIDKYIQLATLKQQ